MIVTSNKSLRFPQFQWGIHAGEAKELPDSEEAREAILAHPAISEGGSDDLNESEVDASDLPADDNDDE